MYGRQQSHSMTSTRVGKVCEALWPSHAAVGKIVHCKMIKVAHLFIDFYDFNEIRKETILKIYKTLVLPTFLYGSENWTLTALQRRRIEVAEMKLLRPLARYSLYDHKTNDSIRCELQAECILDKIDEHRRNWHLHLQRMPPNRIP